MSNRTNKKSYSETPDGAFGESSVTVKRQQSCLPATNVSFLSSSRACPLPEHFVDRHREALIQRTSNISPVLDNLLSQRLLDQEQYDTLRGLRPRQEAMRQLYVYMTIWGHSDKEKFYQALQMHNGPLIRDMENKDPAGILRNNVTFITLLGFPDLPNFTFLFFCLLIIIYHGIISGNLLIIILYLVSKTLQSPMYFFITQLSLCDLLLTTNIVPTLLHTVLYGQFTVSFIGCFIQFYFFVISDTSECLFLSLMSYDRYLAICNPLHYQSVMNHKFCVTTVNVIWGTCAMLTMVEVISINNLNFCRPSVIDHFYCDFEPLMQLSCSDTSMLHKWILIKGFLVAIGPFIIIVVSYVYIAITILKIPSNTGRQKAFSTCSSHLTVVSLFYGAIIIVYMFPTRGQSLILSKVLSLIYTVVTPLLNPIIYTLRNNDFKKAFRKLKCIV
ncbi:olfactory receptor 11A1-like [Bufo bufo]|uniref:olfactory receptor 11A1-like n=1 Tax=Bufo bufo TaxID=8384 RepID=UPI001ABE4FED|nr:olfactory receptor 11A1-like [Bufo bufo]